MDSPSTLTVRVPASTSNLGPGFDALGLALGLWLEVELTPAADGTVAWRERAGEAAAWPGGEDELVERALRAAGARGGFVLGARSDIPVARGLGSSGAAIAAGLLLGAELAVERPDDDALLAAGLELEGHPDNVAASLAGGATVCLPDLDAAGAPVCVAADVHAEVGVAVAWPASPLATARARAVLPDEVAFADAVENPRRLALLLAGLRTADARLIALGIEDRLHVAHRLALIERGGEALAAARAAGAWAATVSGSGSALVALCALDAREAVAAAMAGPLDGTGRALEIVRSRPRVERSS